METGEGATVFNGCEGKNPQALTQLGGSESNDTVKAGEREGPETGACRQCGDRTAGACVILPPPTHTPLMFPNPLHITHGGSSWPASDDSEQLELG